MKPYFRQIYLKFSIVLLCYIFLQCASSNTSSNEKSNTSNLPEPQVPEQETLKNTSRDSIRFSHSVVYYELPDTSLIQNPEDYLTFSQPVKNTSHIDRLKTILTSQQQIYLSSPPKNCSPNFNSALVFHNESDKNIILFSINCGVFYLYKDKLFIDISNQLAQIEDTFRMIRSGR